MGDSDVEKDIQERFNLEKKKLLELAGNSRFSNINSPSYFYLPGKKQYNIKEEVARKESLQNDALEQDINLKRSTLIILFSFLACETFVIFLFTYFQGASYKGFHLEEWSFKLLVTATILQITFMVKIAVKHLFPDNKHS